MGIIRENISNFKRGRESKTALGLGLKSKIREIIRDKKIIKLYGYYDNWDPDQYYDIILNKLQNDVISWNANMWDESGKFDLDNIKEINDLLILLAKPVETDYSE